MSSSPSDSYYTFNVSRSILSHSYQHVCKNVNTYGARFAIAENETMNVLQKWHCINCKDHCRARETKKCNSFHFILYGEIYFIMVWKMYGNFTNQLKATRFWRKILHSWIKDKSTVSRKTCFWSEQNLFWLNRFCGPILRYKKYRRKTLYTYIWLSWLL